MPTSTVLICASPRTGSTLLCTTLADAGIAGNPIEYFDNRPHVEARYKARLGATDDAGYLDALMAEATVDGVCGLKVHWHQRLTMERIVRAGWERAREARPGLAFPDYQRETFGDVKRIWLRRRDHVAQAVSLFRASRTDYWHLARDEQPPAELDEIEYDFDDIDNLVHMMFRNDTAWSKYFREHGLSCLEMFYEDLVADRDGELARAHAFLNGGEPSGPIPAPRLAKLGGSVSAKWVDLYRRDKMVWLTSQDLKVA